MGEADRASLRAAGLTEVESLHVVLGCAVFNYLNRMADGLGIECEYRSALPAIPLGEDPGAGGRTVVSPGPPVHEPQVRLDDRVAGALGEPRHLFDAMTANPAASDGARAWRRFQLEPTDGLDARTRARIALHVARLGGSGYGAAWFEWALARQGGANAARSPREALLLAHAERLTREPWTVRPSHLDLLRAAGLDDLAILRLTMLSSYVGFENRAAAGLGVEIEAAA